MGGQKKVRHEQTFPARRDCLPSACVPRSTLPRSAISGTKPSRAKCPVESFLFAGKFKPPGAKRRLPAQLPNFFVRKLSLRARLRDFLARERVFGQQVPFLSSISFEYRCSVVEIFVLSSKNSPVFVGIFSLPPFLQTPYKWRLRRKIWWSGGGAQKRATPFLFPAP